MTKNNRTPQERQTTNITPFKDRLTIYRKTAKVFKEHGILKTGTLNGLCIAAVELILKITKEEPQLANTLLPRLAEMEAAHAIADSTKKRGRKPLNKTKE